MFFTLSTINLIRQLFSIMEFLQTLIKRYNLLFYFIIHFIYWAMSHNLVTCGVVVVFNHLRMPFDCNMTFFQPVKDANVFSWLNNTTTAFIGPVTLGTAVTLSIYHLKYEWLGFTSWIYTFWFIKNLFPIWKVPPQVVGIKKPGVLFQDSMSHWPNFFVNSLSSWLQR